MTTYDFQHLLFVFSFLIMVIDGNIHPKEKDFNRGIYHKIESDEAIPYETMVPAVLAGIKENPSVAIKEYFQTLENIEFNNDEKEEFTETAYDIIHADNMVHPSEWEFILLTKNKIGITDADFKKEFGAYSAEDRIISTNPEFLDEFLNSLDFSRLGE